MCRQSMRKRWRLSRYQIVAMNIQPQVPGTSALKINTISFSKRKIPRTASSACASRASTEVFVRKPRERAVVTPLVYAAEALASRKTLFSTAVSMDSDASVLWGGLVPTAGSRSECRNPSSTGKRRSSACLGPKTSSELCQCRSSSNRSPSETLWSCTAARALKAKVTLPPSQSKTSMWNSDTTPEQVSSILCSI